MHPWNYCLLPYIMCARLHRQLCILWNKDSWLWCVLEFPDGWTLNYTDVCWKTCSYFQKIIQCFSTCKAHAVALTDPNSANSDISQLAQSKAYTNSSQHTKILTTFHWIPGQKGIRGNENAGLLTKEGSQKEQVHKPCNYSTAKKKFKEVWLNSWKNQHRQYLQSCILTLTTPNPKDSIHYFDRTSALFSDENLTFKIELPHGFDTQHLPLSWNCDYSYKNINHVLFQCQATLDQRNLCLPIQ